MQIALKKDVMSLKKYIEDVKICVKEVEEYVSKKKFKHALLGIYLNFNKNESKYIFLIMKLLLVLLVLQKKRKCLCSQIQF